MSLLFEAVLAVLMVALIVYCIKLNKRLSLLRSQNAEFADMMTGLSEASERAEQAVQHLKTTGLSAEKSLRLVINDAKVAQVDLARLLATSAQATAPKAPPQSPAAPVQSVPSPEGAAVEPGHGKIQRDMLMGETTSSSNNQESATAPPQNRPKTRKEAEETVLQAIRSARVGS